MDTVTLSTPEPTSTACTDTGTDFALTRVSTLVGRNVAATIAGFLGSRWLTIGSVVGVVPGADAAPCAPSLTDGDTYQVDDPSHSQIHRLGQVEVPRCVRRHLARLAQETHAVAAGIAHLGLAVRLAGVAPVVRRLVRDRCRTSGPYRERECPCLTCNRLGPSAQQEALLVRRQPWNRRRLSATAVQILRPLVGSGPPVSFC
jgi:hypothetical protein